MRRQLFTAFMVTIALTLLLGIVFPLVVTCIGQLAFADRANGSLVKRSDGRVVGSSLIGQAFLTKAGDPDSRYFQPRPSAAGTGYDAMASSASNLGPSNADLLKSVADRVRVYRSFNGLGANASVPVDAVTSSGSGLDPHISVNNARLQAGRVARERGRTIADVNALIARHTDLRMLGFVGEDVVNVLELNLDLDRRR